MKLPPHFLWLHRDASHYRAFDRRCQERFHALHEDNQTLNTLWIAMLVSIAGGLAVCGCFLLI